MINEVDCPRCGVRMDFQAETEIMSDRMKRIRYLYKCPACGVKINDVELRVSRNGGITISVYSNGNPRGYEGASAAGQAP
jgi:hypothetical protein